MWLSRQLDLYAGALLFGLARYFGCGTYASALMHGGILLAILFG